MKFSFYLSYTRIPTFTMFPNPNIMNVLLYKTKQDFKLCQMLARSLIIRKLRFKTQLLV